MSRPGQISATRTSAVSSPVAKSSSPSTSTKRGLGSVGLYARNNFGSVGATLCGRPVL